MKKKLKSPEFKVPPLLRDLYQDLHDRRLLPLVALLLVAIVAAPILLSDPPPEKTPPPSRGAGATAATAPPAAMAVVRATPGLRAPSKRLKHRRPADPFRQKYASPPLSSAPVTVESTEGSSEVEADATPDDVPPVTTVRSGVIFYATTVTLKIVRSEEGIDGKIVHQPPVIRERVLPSTTLLGEKAQIVTYMGPSPKTRNPTFLISEKVTAVFGEGKCLAGTERCELIELAENEPQVFVYGANDVRYKFVVLGTELVETGRGERP
jgi:hypothetical protein